MEGLSMSLDEYAKKQKQEQFSQKRGQRRGGNNFKQRRYQPYQPYQKGNQWEHDRYNDDFGGVQKNQNRFQMQSADERTILRVSNLHFSVLENELREMFEVYGQLNKCEIDWDNFGRSEGTAVVQYLSPEAARRAIEEYNGVELDGLTLGVEYGARELLFKKNNNLISKNRTFKKFGRPKFKRFQRPNYQNYE